MSVALKKLEGMETVEVSLEKSSAVMTLKPDNKITLPLLRRTIRSNGYPTRDAQITARGRLADRDGKPVLDLLNGTALDLESMPEDAPGEVVEVTGVSRERQDGGERMTVSAIKR